MALAAIRPMTAADVVPAVDLLRRGNWGARAGFFRYAVDQPFVQPFVAERDGEIVGTGVASAHGPVGWVGTIFVAPSERERGLGGALTERVVAALREAGCGTLVLVATDAGRPLYERLGFETRSFYQTFELEGRAPSGRDALAGAASLDGTTARPLRQADLDEVADLDGLATGEERRAVLAATITEGGLTLRAAAGTLLGFVARAPWGGGATVAVSREAALALLDARRLRAGPEHMLRAGTPIENETGMAALRAAGWRAGYRVRRMELGPRPDWRPARLWGQFNMAIG